ncbi:MULTISPECIES: ArdC family protein [Bradyrhizobium]|uniref:Antirestriction protein ArdC n=2 Tax=Bradyrhizobium TaxID=374 RepID=A0ABY0Q8H7_9BRAD|nr:MULTISPECIES: zincin-like metallopeptidase domain-containing protein [Bradyrhizobium]SDJ68704.1 Antirestriction protein ArdC [Bradyrhizobium ottawaense]SEC25518.1 Antirestriction protein ArdC [Bradyrhizobium lablabi]
MSRHVRKAQFVTDRTNLYEDITRKIIAELEAGSVPWVRPWAAAKAPLALPHNAATRRRYGGINILILLGAAVERGFSGQSWLTFRQALSIGGCVRKGERGTTVVYTDRFVPAEEIKRASTAGDEARAIPFLKRFTVFNTEQCDGLSADASSIAPSSHMVEPQVEALIRATRIDFRIGGDRAFYCPRNDYVQVPALAAYFETINWHRTALHELAHASGHSSRLNRDLSGGYGTKEYAFEEIIAEMSSSFCCASLGIVPTVRHADYIDSWLKVLREDNRAIVRAASQASKVADYLLGFLPDLGVGAPTLVDDHEAT